MLPPGRFLARVDDTKRGPGSVKAADNVWYEVGDKKAREKASQCLRERTPDVIPYIKHLREQQNALTEQGVSLVQQQLLMQQQQQQGGDFGGGDPFGAAGAAMQPFPRGKSNPTASKKKQVPNALVQSLQAQASRGSSVGTRPGAVTAPVMALSSPGAVAGGKLPVAPAGANSLFLGSSDDAFVDEMAEMEYQHNMMLMQQQMQMQQIQMQRMQQQRLAQRAMRMQQQQQQQQQGMGGAGGTPGLGKAQKKPDQQQPTPAKASSNGEVVVAEKESNNSSSNNAKSGGTNNDKKRSRGEIDRAVPDRAPSAMSFTPLNSNDDNELTLEEYRQQLEEYISNSTSQGLLGGGDDDDGCHSDLEDDWEKEREKAYSKQQADAKAKQRGVNRNVSGMSCISNKSGTGMSLVSGFSGFSDMNFSEGDIREAKMNMQRSVCSNLSLMSELTDLSQNIDNLSLYDD
jgi:hypothetical protein